MIIEASKLKPRQKAAEAEPPAKAPDEKVTARPAVGKPSTTSAAPQPARAATAERTASLAAASTAVPSKPERSALIEQTPPLVLVKLKPQPAIPAQSPPAAEAEAQPISPPASPLPTAASHAEPEISTAESNPDDYFGARPPLNARPEHSNARATSAQPGLRVPPPPAVSTAAAAPVPLQIAEYVEPALPDRLRRNLQADGDVVINFTVNRDGSVADASVRSSSDTALEPIALDAVRQWRYKPIADARSHSAKLVFRLRD